MYLIYFKDGKIMVGLIIQETILSLHFLTTSIRAEYYGKIEQKSFAC